ncbi:MAG: hypothetical protein QOD07_1581 [Frankiaceae bacterium]|jgi:hypothetical protein|nr:hypothetical protein [Frankiaceae bacterium]
MIATGAATFGALFAMTAPGAQAANLSDDLGSGGAGLINLHPYTQWCQPEFVQAPVGLGQPGGATIEVQAAGVVEGTDVLATRITCTITQDGQPVLTVDSGFQRDNAAAATGSFVEQNNDPLTKCVQVSFFNGTTQYGPLSCGPV